MKANGNTYEAGLNASIMQENMSTYAIVDAMRMLTCIRGL